MPSLARACAWCAALAVALFACAALTFVVLLLSAPTFTPAKVDDPAAAFVTAKIVAALRAVDAASESPRIGSNIGGGPDLAAAALAGTSGAEIAREYASVLPNTDAAQDMATRTMWLDEAWMAALDGAPPGSPPIRQFVLLAAGLDARAWRMPRMTKDTHLFEVDVPEAVAFKNQRIADGAIANAYGSAETACTRVVVEADLSDPSWGAKLVAAGFRPSEPSFFMVEGLLMYLPEGAPESLMAAVSALMSPGSVVAGDAMINTIIHTRPINKKLAEWGTQWTFDFRSRTHLLSFLGDAGFADIEIGEVYSPGTGGAGGGWVVVDGGSDGDGGDDAREARRTAQKVARALDALPMWPAFAVDYVLGQVGTDAGTIGVIEMLVADSSNTMGLRDESDEAKAAIVKLLLDSGAVQRLQERAAAVASNETRVQLRLWDKAVQFAEHMWLSMRTQVYGEEGTGTLYLMYKAVKPGAEAAGGTDL